MFNFRKLWFIFLLLLELWAVGRPVDDFDSQRAWKHIQQQVSLGPRPSGSEALQLTRNYLCLELKAYGLEVEQQIFDEQTPRGKIRFVNLMAQTPKTWLDRLGTEPAETVILGSHYDTKYFPDFKFVGANDGASSTGVLLELARVISCHKLKPWGCKIKFVFFDGEECYESYHDRDGLHGSRYFVQQLKPEAISKIRAMILLDMIGDRDLSIQLPAPHAELASKVFDASEALGYRNFFRLGIGSILDDHTPFVKAGIPAIDLIDFDYGTQNRWWHTADDSLDKLSPKSLDVVGKTILKMLE